MPASRRAAARAVVLLMAAGLVLMAMLIVAVVWLTRWATNEMRSLVEPPTAAGGAIAGPPVVGPAAPARVASADEVASAAAAPSTARPEALPSIGPSSTLSMPVDGVSPEGLHPSFSEARGGRVHEALDIMAPHGTPVRAVGDGRIAKLFTSDAGGLTIYQFDRDERLVYYYAHLDRYAPKLAEGAAIRRGEVIGYVGSTGNASPDAPHLHLAVFVLGPEKRWWEGRPIDPYPLLRGKTP